MKNAARMVASISPVRASVRRDELNACFPGLLDAILETPEAFLGARTERN